MQITRTSPCIYTAFNKKGKNGNSGKNSKSHTFEEIFEHQVESTLRVKEYPSLTPNEIYAIQRSQCFANLVKINMPSFKDAEKFK